MVTKNAEIQTHAIKTAKGQAWLKKWSRPTGKSLKLISASMHYSLYEANKRALWRWYPLREAEIQTHDHQEDFSGPSKA